MPSIHQKYQILGISYKIADAIEFKESGGNCAVSGKSGEKGCFQFMPQTWKAVTEEFNATGTPMTADNEKLLATLKIDQLAKAGDSPYQIGLYWNSGHIGKCSKGINKEGIKYDSCSYAQEISDLVASSSKAM